MRKSGLAQTSFIFAALTVVHFLISSNILSRTTSKKMTERRAVIKSADMSEDMQQDAVDCTSMALEKYNIEKVSCITSSVVWN